MKNYKGITLISLVITIIVMLILAAVSINFVIEDNSIINRAKIAKIENRYAIVEDKVALWRADNVIARNTNGIIKTSSELIQELKNDNLVFDNEINVDEKYIIINDKKIDYFTLDVSIEKEITRKNAAIIKANVNNEKTIKYNSWEEYQSLKSKIKTNLENMIQKRSEEILYELSNMTEEEKEIEFINTLNEGMPEELGLETFQNFDDFLILFSK